MRIRCDVERIVVERRPRGGRHGQRPDDQVPGGRVERQSEGHDLATGRRASTSTAEFLEEARAVRLNNSSTQVYMALKAGRSDRRSRRGDLLFSSTAREFRTDLLLSRNITSRTFSFYYPRTRPEPGRDA